MRTATAAPVRAADLEEALAAVLALVEQHKAEQSARNATYEARFRALEGRHGPRDAEEARLLEVIADSTAGRLFRAGDLWRHARVDEGLSEALRAAGLQSVDELGAWLRDRRGEAAGIAVSRHGRRWHVARTSDT